MSCCNRHVDSPSVLDVLLSSHRFFACLPFSDERRDGVSQAVGLYGGQFACAGGALSCRGLLLEDVHLNSSRKGCTFEHASGSSGADVQPASCRPPAAQSDKTEPLKSDDADIISAPATSSGRDTSVRTRKHNNVLMIVADNYRPAMGAYGSKEAVTPRLDALAKASTLFARGFCQEAWCGKPHLFLSAFPMFVPSLSW
jgi:hypothetical protein